MPDLRRRPGCWRPRSPATAADDFTAPRTPWGDPDLQGIWSTGYIQWLGDARENRIFESACHEGNYALTGILAGARATDAAR